MKIEKFEEISSWQKSKELTLKIYKIFKNNRDYSFRDQLQRAAVSVMNNIAEGFERQSNREFKHFLLMAKGSRAEFRSMLYVAQELSYITNGEFNDLHELSMQICRLISALAKTL